MIAVGVGEQQVADLRAVTAAAPDILQDTLGACSAAGIHQRQLLPAVDQVDMAVARIGQTH
jgi:hypothetical protein